MKLITCLLFLFPLCINAQLKSERKFEDTAAVKRLYKKITEYDETEKKNVNQLKELIEDARKLKEHKLADSFTNVYVDCLTHTSKDYMFTKEEVSFLHANTRNTKNYSFKIFYGNDKKIDSLMNEPGYCLKTVEWAITSEFINPILIKASSTKSDPDWKSISKYLKTHFKKVYVDVVISDAKIRWLGSKKDWKTYCKEMVNRVDKFGPFGILSIKHWQWNDVAWNMFERSTDKKELIKALRWVDSAIKLCPTPNGGYYDTRANLLYKIGNVAEAVFWQEKAIAIDPKNPDIAANFEKMKMCQPTWPVD